MECYAVWSSSVSTAVALGVRTQPSVNSSGGRQPESPKLFAKSLGPPSATHRVAFGPFLQRLETETFRQSGQKCENAEKTSVEMQRAGRFSPGPFPLTPRYGKFG